MIEYKKWKENLNLIMDTVKKFFKYIIGVILLMVFTNLCTYLGFNATYKNIDKTEDLPQGIDIKLSQATKVCGRIYGEVTSDADNNLEGKFIKTNIYTDLGTLVGTKYIKIKDINQNEAKKFAVNFQAENVKFYNISIVDNNEEEEFENENIFIDDELPMYAIIILVLYCLV